MKFALKIGSFFFLCQVIVGYKNENLGVIEDFKKRKEKKRKKNF